MLELYKNQIPCLVALDSIIFGFDGKQLKLLLVNRGLETEGSTWSLIGGWLQPNESLDEAAHRILFEHTGLKDVYLEQLTCFGNPKRDPIMRTVSVTYKALVNIDDYEKKISNTLSTAWFSLRKLPKLLFDHAEMVEIAVERLRKNAALHPIGFELLPEKFTLLQLQNLYEAIFDTQLDKRNFSRRILSTGYIIKTNEKQIGFSKKGAYFYSLNKNKFPKNKTFSFLFMPNTERIL